MLALTSTETSEDGKLTRQLFSCGCSNTSAWVAPLEPFEDGRDITRMIKKSGSHSMRNNKNKMASAIGQGP